MQPKPSISAKSPSLLAAIGVGPQQPAGPTGPFGGPGDPGVFSIDEKAGPSQQQINDTINSFLRPFIAAQDMGIRNPLSVAMIVLSDLFDHTNDSIYLSTMTQCQKLIARSSNLDQNS